MPLGPFLDRYPHINERLKGRENQRIQCEYYAIPVSLPKSDHIGMIRGDWLDRLNLEIPTTVEELYRVARAFKDELGIYPISSSPPHTAGFFWLNYLFYAFGGGWDTWIRNEDGSYVMCWVSEGIHWRKESGRKEPLLPFDESGGTYTRLREVDRSSSLRDFVELGDIWIPEWDRNAGIVRQAVESGEKCGQIPLFLYDKTVSEKKYRKTLTDMVFQEYVKLVRSADFEEDWDGFLRRWREAGGDQMTRERNAEWVERKSISLGC